MLKELLNDQAFLFGAAGLLFVLLLASLIFRPNCRSCGWPKGGDTHRLAHDPDPRNRMWTRPEWAEYQRSGRKPSWDKSR